MKRISKLGIRGVLFCSALFVNACDDSEASGETITYYMNIADFSDSFIQIPTSNVDGESSTASSSYLVGRAAIYNDNNEKAGTCSASFLSMQNDDGIFTDISNHLSADNGLIVTWFTPTTLDNLDLSTIINSMVTESMAAVTTKAEDSSFFGHTFHLVVSSDNEKIYFEFQESE